MLQKQTITIPLGLGINTKTDEKLVEAGQFNLVSENTTFKKVGAVTKRDAYKEVSTTYYEPNNSVGSGTGTIAGLTNRPTCLATLGESVFLRNKAGEYLYSHNSDLVYKKNYPIPECRVNSVPIYSAKMFVDSTDCDFEPTEGILAIAIRDGITSSDSSNPSSGFILFDYEKKTSISPQAVSAVSATYYFGNSRAGWTRVAGVSYYYHIYVAPDRTLNIKTYNKYGQLYGSLITISGIVSDGGSASDHGTIAVCRSTDNTKFFIIVPTTTTSQDKFICISGTTVLANATLTRGVASTGWQSASARYDSSKVRFAMLRSDTVFETILNEDGTVSTAETSKFTILNGKTIAYSQESNNITFSHGALGSVISGRFYTSFGIKETENYNTTFYTDSVSVEGIIQSICTSSTGDDFNSYFVIPPDTGAAGAKVMARVSQGNALASSGQISRIAKITDNIYAAVLPYNAGSNGIYSLANANLYFFEINQDHASNGRSVIGKNIHFTGGFVSEFDGETLMENGFHLRCPPLEIAASGASGLTGTYSYIGVLKYVDKNGQITRSEPSKAVSTGAISNKTVEITMPSVPFGVKALNCQVEIYRTKNNGSTYYLVNTVVASMFSGNKAWSTSITDTASDATIADNTLLYTTGNVLANAPGPSAWSMCQGGNRIILFGLEDENEIAFSKTKLFGEAVNFSDFFRIRIDTSQYNIAGGCRAGGYMDGKIIIFKKNSIFYVQGDGPLETGADDTFTTPELITAESGCYEEPRSVVLTPIGLMYKGEKGFYVLSRGLESQYIGASVEEFNEYKVTSAVHLDKKSQVIFTLVSSDLTQKVMLSFDYYTQQWSVTKGIRALDSDVIDGNHVALSSDTNSPFIQNGTDFLDNSTPYSIRVKTPWIKVSGIQDYGRIWSATILGKYKAAHTLRVTVRYDYATDYSEVYDIFPDSSDSQYQYRIHLKKQKCESIQFEIQDLDQVGESMELTALTLEVGVRRGSMKLSSQRKY